MGWSLLSDTLESQEEYSVYIKVHINYLVQSSRYVLIVGPRRLTSRSWPKRWSVRHLSRAGRLRWCCDRASDLFILSLNGEGSSTLSSHAYSEWTSPHPLHLTPGALISAIAEDFCSAAWKYYMMSESRDWNKYYRLNWNKRLNRIFELLIATGELEEKKRRKIVKSRN